MSDDAVPTLTAREHAAVRRLIHRALAPGEPPVRGIVLFGSKARGDHHGGSDVDLLVVCDVEAAAREAAAARLERLARGVARRTGVRVEAWTVASADLRQGRRTPMLVDALADGVPLWPDSNPLPPLPFTPADARFCAGCLLEWVSAGARASARELAAGRLQRAAQRARDDITRLATAALLLTGDTRHRQVGSLRRFEQRFVRPRVISTRVVAALAWAASAYPEQGAGADPRRPPPAPEAVASAELGCDLAAIMRRETVPWIVSRMGELKNW